jgi:3-dehydroquinate synthetase
MNEITAQYGGTKYNIYITNNFDNIDACLDEYEVNEKILVVSDSKAADLYGMNS